MASRKHVERLIDDFDLADSGLGVGRYESHGVGEV
jgi:hypothetical protein